ncbi:MAG: Transcriptional regulator, AraC family [Sphingobacteriales bacterium]|nr:Transcriptional regulator, AraC family [Sphingobacteriales bacterium]
MKTIFYPYFKENKNSFNLVESNIYHALNDFHYHEELELIYVTEGQGLLLIGDQFEQLITGDMILIGGNVPHMFKFDTFRFENELLNWGKIDLPLKLVSLHFDPHSWGQSFLALPENETLNQLFTDCKRGMMIKGADKEQVKDLMMKLIKAPAYEHFLLLIQLFNTIALSKTFSFLTKLLNKNPYTKIDEHRLSTIYIYTLNNFTRTITLKEIADITYMCPNAFCRYFKLRTKKSYFEFLMEVRINYACKLLREKDFNTVVICYNSGFGNLSNFNRHFKALTGKTPLEYRRSFAS